VRSVFSEEPAYLDLRWARTASSLSLKDPPCRDAVADLLARLTGREKAEVLGDDLRQQRRALRLAWSAAAALVVLASAAVAAAWFAVQQRTVAVARQLVAQSRLLANERPALLDRSALLVRTRSTCSWLSRKPKPTTRMRHSWQNSLTSC
jgi:hypothetical protein